MTTSIITATCHSCGTEVQGVFHVMLCNDCLEAHLEQMEQIVSPG